MCAHLGPGSHGTLCCDRKDVHPENTERGHTYTGTFASDAHDRSEAESERSRG